MKNTKKKGFTIVELVIVIAVIGILSAILIPTFSGLVKNAQDTALQENLRNAYVEYTSKEATAGTYKAQKDVVFAVTENATTVYYQYDEETGTYEVATGYVALTQTWAEAYAAAEVGNEVAAGNYKLGTYNTYVAYAAHEAVTK